MSNDCVFCDRTKFEDRLVGEHKDFWIIATLGQIKRGYLLLVPKEHIPCLGAVDKLLLNSFRFLVSKIRLAFILEYGSRNPTLFEHGIVGQTVKHAHLHLIPKSVHLTKRVLKDFPNSLFTVVPSWNMLRDLYSQKQEPYLMWSDLSSEMRVCWNPEAPPQYMRLIYAEAVGYPERGNWRNMKPELDKQFGEDTVSRLKPYFRS